MHNYISFIGNPSFVTIDGSTGDIAPAAPSVIVLTRDPSLAGKLNTFLSAGGYLIAGIAADLASLLHLLFEYCPDLVIIDTGAVSITECGEAASIVQHTYYTPVLLLATPGDRSIYEIARISEPAGIIIKPLIEEDLLNRVSRILRRSSPFSGKSKGPRRSECTVGNRVRPRPAL